MKLVKFTFIITAVLTLSACQTIKYTAPTPEHKIIELNSVPQGASVYMNGQLVCESTPGYIEIETPIRRDAWGRYVSDELILTFVKEGYETTEAVYKASKVISQAFVNQINGNITPFFVGKTSKNLNLDIENLTTAFEWPNAVLCEMQPKTNAFNETASNTTSKAAKANKKVTGDGSTSLENTVIRWYIDSYPKGADVFTRVISSTPDVKNSNQNYVGTTPYETTEAFDIKGLSLNNAGDVQIEVTCEKPGYLSQKKRFNVLQAIDQKEISTKFNLVKDE